VRGGAEEKLSDIHGATQEIAADQMAKRAIWRSITSV
jgi:hypothetical protein